MRIYIYLSNPGIRGFLRFPFLYTKEKGVAHFFHTQIRSKQATRGTFVQRVYIYLSNPGIQGFLRIYVALIRNKIQQSTILESVKNEECSKFSPLQS